jgi:hypothetical protein
VPSSAVLNPNLGLYLGRSPLAVPTGGLSDGYNFRIKNGKLGNRQLGWTQYTTIEFDGPITLIDTFIIRGANQRQIIGTPTSLYDYDAETDTAVYLNPRYATGTAAASGTAVTGMSTAWETAEIAEGDFISFGDAAETDPDADWFEIESVYSETGISVVSSAGTVADGVFTIRRSFSGSLVDFWRTESFVSPNDGTGEELWFATNGIVPVVTWDGQATEVTSQDALGFTCKELRVYKNMMIYANLLESGGGLEPTSIINSDVGDPLEVGAGLAGQFRVHDSFHALVQLQNLGDNLVLYGRESKVILLQFVGDPLVFVFREASGEAGPVAGRLVANFGDYHEFIGTDGQYLFDGVAVTEVGKHVWRELSRQRDPLRQDLGFTHFDDEWGELYWIPALTSDTGFGDADEGPEDCYTEH